MIHDLTELKNRSENGDTLSQIKLFFKQYYDFDDIRAAIMTCDKWRHSNLFLEGVWTYYSFCEYHPNDKKYDYRENKIGSSWIFKQLIDSKDVDNEITGYAYNMMAICINKNNRQREEYLNFAIKQGIEYAHNNLANNLTDVESKVHHYEIAASKSNKWALLNLAKIYLTDDQHRNPPRAIECYQKAVKYGYDLGSIETVLLLENHDINITIQLLEYESGRKNYDALVGLAAFCARNDKLFDQILRQFKTADSEYSQWALLSLAAIYLTPSPKGVTNF